MQLNFFSRTKKAFGLEISDFSLKALYLQKRGQRFVIAGYNRARLPKGVVENGEIKQESELASLIRQLLDTAKPQKITTPFLVTSLPENNSYVSTITVPEMTRNELEEAIKWEAENHIPLPVNDVYFGWQIIARQKNKIKILLAAAPKKIINGYLNACHLAKLKPQALEPEAASEGRALIPQHNDGNYLLVDIGATKTTFSILSNTLIHFSSSITNISGNYFTKIITQCLNIKEGEAEKIKITCCSPRISETERKLLASVHPAFDELAEEILKIQQYFYNNFDATSRQPVNIILCGGGAGLFGIAPYLSLKLKQKVRLGDPWTNVPLAKPSPIILAEALGYTQVIGLALRGASLDDYQQNDHS